MAVNDSALAEDETELAVWLVIGRGECVNEIDSKILRIDTKQRQGYSLLAMHQLAIFKVYMCVIMHGKHESQKLSLGLISQKTGEIKRNFDFVAKLGTHEFHYTFAYLHFVTAELDRFLVVANAYFNLVR